MSHTPFDTQFAHDIYRDRYQHPEDGDWYGTAQRVAYHPFEHLTACTGVYTESERDSVADLFSSRQALPGGRYLYATGRELHQVNNCVLLRCDDSREGWAENSYRAEMALMTGAGIGTWYGDVRPGGSPIHKTGGLASGPIPKMQQINETGRHIMQGGNRRSAIWAGLPWWHADIFDFMTVKDWPEEIRALKAKDHNFPAPMDKTNISVTLDDAFFWAYESYEAGEGLADALGPCPGGSGWHEWAQQVYHAAVAHMLKHGEPGFTIDRGDKSDEVLRNACTEITSADDSDVCNLGSLVLPRFSSPQEFGRAVRRMAQFLTAGTVYSHVPYDKVAEVREQNRRLGLGLIGVHEFCMLNGARYGSDESFEVLDPYMAEYARALEYAHDYQDRHGLSHSLGATAIAPNGTIGIVAESTPSSDPLYSAAEIRKVNEAHHSGSDVQIHNVVVDPVARRLREQGVPASVIEDAHTLALYPERRLAMVEYLQRHVDHAISGTINLPQVVTDPREAREFGATLMRYLPNIRGITCYPDGARSGQPRTPVDLDWALANDGSTEFTEAETCVGGACGI